MATILIIFYLGQIGKINTVFTYANVLSGELGTGPGPPGIPVLEVENNPPRFVKKIPEFPFFYNSQLSHLLH